MARIVFILFVLVFYACSGKHPANKHLQIIDSKQEDSIKFASYKDVPLAIRHTLDSMEGGHFSIADTGEMWNCCCTRMPGLPEKKFIEASRQRSFFRLSYLTGGFATTSHTISVQCLRKEDGSENYKIVSNSFRE